MKTPKKIKVHSSMPDFIRLEKALIRANEEIGWKNMTGFIVKWTNENQDEDDSYSLKFWLQQSRKI